MSKVSVIIPVYNVENYLRQCLDSVKNQTLSDLEIITVDDGSTDGSGKICDEYAACDSRFKVIHKINGGLASARLAGARAAMGEYIVNADGDDYLEKDMIESLYDAASENLCDVVICAFNRVLPDGSVRHVSYKLAGVYDRKRIEKEIIPFVVPGTDAEIFSPNVWTKLIKRELYLKNLVYYDEKLSMSEDVVITVANVINALKLVYVDKPLYNYRITEGQMTAKYKPEYYDSEMTAEKSVIRAAADAGYDVSQQIKRRYVSFAFWQIKTALSFLKDKTEIKRVVNKWSENKIYSDANTKGWTKKEKIKYFLLKNRNYLLLKLVCKHL